MAQNASPVPRAVRGRVVMLIDNGVVGDSRVQKSARSAADAGWDVVLIGRSPTDKPQSWQLGLAEVRLLPIPMHLAKRAHEFRRKWLRAPLAFPPTGISLHHNQRARAWQADLKVRGALLTLSARSEPLQRRSAPRRIAFKIRKRKLRFERMLARTYGRWVRFRHSQLHKARTARRSLDTAWDRAYTTFWMKVMGDRAWRRLEPRLWEYELAFGRVIDELEPDLIHAHDFRMIGVGARAAIRGRVSGRPVKMIWDAHEYLPGLDPGANTARWLPAHVANEREYAPHADAVVTISGTLAELLQQEHGLTELPTVILNAPSASTDENEPGTPVPDIRELCGVDAGTPLVAYSGGISTIRGVNVMVEALPAMPNVHIALVSVPPSGSVGRAGEELIQQAKDLGVADRVHLLPYVAHNQVAEFLSGADAAVSPLLHVPNHEIALSNKFFEYAQARLPMVISDIRTMAATTTEVGQGEVFRAGDTEDYIRAVKAVLANPERYRAAYDRPGVTDEWTWEAQATKLDRLYSRLLPHLPRLGDNPDGTPDVTVVVLAPTYTNRVRECMTSLNDQTLGRDRIEIIVISEGSSDVAKRGLESLASRWPAARVVVHDRGADDHAAMQNAGLELATGRYVLFVYAEDYLDENTLARMVAVADDHKSDVVLATSVVATGELPPTHAFIGEHADVPLAELPPAVALESVRLYRRDMLTTHGLRHKDLFRWGSDRVFVLDACARAERISVLADRTYQFSRRGSGRWRSIDVDHCLERVAELARIADSLGPGQHRDTVNAQNAAAEVLSLLRPEFLELDGSAQRHICDEIRRVTDSWLTDGVRDQLDVSARLRLSLAHAGHIEALCSAIRQDAAATPPVVIDGGRVFLAYDSFRNASVSVPDRWFEVLDVRDELVARPLVVQDITWDSSTTSAGQLRLTLRSSFDLSAFADSDLRMSLNGVPADLATAPATDGGTTINARFDVAELLSDPRTADGLRNAVRLQLTSPVRTWDVALSPRPGLAARAGHRRHGGQVLRLKPTARNGRVIIEIAPITVRRIIGRLLRGSR